LQESNAEYLPNIITQILNHNNQKHHESYYQY